MVKLKRGRHAAGSVARTARLSSTTAMSAIQPLHDTAHRVGHVGPRQRERQVRLEKSDLVAAVEAATVEPEAVDRDPADLLGDRVGDLDLAAGAALLAVEMLEHAGM